HYSDGLDDAQLIRDGGIFQRATIGHLNIFAGDALNGDIQIVERRSVHALCNLCAQPAETPALFDDYETSGLFDRGHDRWDVQGFEGPGIDDFDLDALSTQLIGCLQRQQEHFRIGDDGDIVSGTFHLGDTDGDRVFTNFDFPL